MRAKNPAPGDLEAIETASRDELQALQLERLKWTLRHAYDNVAHYRASFDAAGVRPEDLRALSDLHKFPFTVKTDLRDHYPFGMFAVPREQIVRIHASSGTTGRPTVVGYTARDIDTWSTVMARSIRAAGGRAGDIVHVAYGYGLFTGGLGAHYGAERLGLHRDSDVGRHDRAAGPAHHRFQTRDHHGDAVLHASDRRGDAAAGARPAPDVARDRHFRRGAVDAGDARRDRGHARHRRHRHLWPFRNHRSRRRAGMHRDQGRFDRLGGSLLSRDRRPRDGRRGCRGREGRARVHHAHQGSVADDSLSHARSDTPAACKRAVDAPHGKNHWPLRRHADHSRRQRFSLAGGGPHPQAGRARAALLARGDAPRQISTK